MVEWLTWAKLKNSLLSFDDFDLTCAVYRNNGCVWASSYHQALLSPQGPCSVLDTLEGDLIRVGGLLHK